MGALGLPGRAYPPAGEGATPLGRPLVTRLPLGLSPRRLSPLRIASPGPRSPALWAELLRLRICEGTLPERDTWLLLRDIPLLSTEREPVEGL